MDISVILVEIRDEGNLGAIARLCDNFGIKELIVINPQCDVYSDIVYQRATRARHYIDDLVILDSLDDIKAYVNYAVALTGRLSSNTKIGRISIPLPQVSELLKSISGKIGVILGRESTGLTNEELKNADLTATILVPGENQILNISHALAVALYEFSNVKLEEQTLNIISSRQKAVLDEYLRNILKSTNLVPEQIESTSTLFNAIVGRSLVSESEANGLLGMFRRISNTINKNKQSTDRTNL